MHYPISLHWSNFLPDWSHQWLCLSSTATLLPCNCGTKNHFFIVFFFWLSVAMHCLLCWLF